MNAYAEHNWRIFTATAVSSKLLQRWPRNCGLIRRFLVSTLAPQLRYIITNRILVVVLCLPIYFFVCLSPYLFLCLSPSLVPVCSNEPLKTWCSTLTCHKTRTLHASRPRATYLRNLSACNCPSPRSALVSPQMSPLHRPPNVED